jgi:hypothetical protein
MMQTPTDVQICTIVFQSVHDQNFTQNVLARLFDQDSNGFTPFKQVTAILLERTERFRLGLLLNQDSSSSPVMMLSTESE